MRICELEDKPVLATMIAKRVDDLLDEFLTADKSEKVVIAKDDKGVMVAISFNTPGGKIATDVLWWVDKGKRHKGLGSELLAALEEWAKTVGCKFVYITSLNASVGKDYFEERGYTQLGLAWVKEI